VDLPVIITSGSRGGASQSELQSLGVSELLSKPVSYATLAGALSRALLS
jgi:CheY-like chemotaxis protein